MAQEEPGWSPQPFRHPPPAPAGHRPSPSSWSGRGSCRAPGGCRPDCTGPSASPAPGACRTGGAQGEVRAGGDRELPLPHRSSTRATPRRRGRGQGAEEGAGGPDLAVEAQGHGLVLQRHEEGAAVQLVLQVEHHGVHWGRGSILGQGQRFGMCGQPSAPGGAQGPPKHRAHPRASPLAPQGPSSSHHPHPTQHRAITTFPQTLSPSQGSFAAQMLSRPPVLGSAEPVLPQDPPSRPLPPQPCPLPRSVSPLSMALLRASLLRFIFSSSGTCSPERGSYSSSCGQRRGHQRAAPVGASTPPAPRGP